MAIRARAVVTGDKEIAANLRRAQRSIGGAWLDNISMEALEPMRSETEQNAKQLRRPFNPRGGHLDEGVVIQKTDQKGTLFRIYWVAFRKRARKIAHLVEFGTAPHFQPKRNQMHPGARPKPFFRPAYESTKNEVVSFVSRETWAKIEQSVIQSFRAK